MATRTGSNGDFIQLGVTQLIFGATESKAITIGLALRAFLRMKDYCYLNGISWFEAKLSIVREAIRSC